MFLFLDLGIIFKTIATTDQPAVEAYVTSVIKDLTAKSKTWPSKSHRATSKTNTETVSILVL
jgi:hypothetical protein